ncbi:hypothetical protein LX32DRAFT_349233 [Colletotrichum zoysiae]|uniref:Uncharacterized protein n=1 Tax=Colletotrichum zoysiae TaxID=1216348 RepID=A0AAD9HIG3_9PEZI|nr:hypothetical protein LX32DRAFT_349233 [Colletotrichum zoysiae]
MERGGNRVEIGATLSISAHWSGPARGRGACDIGGKLRVCHPYGAMDIRIPHPLSTKLQDGERKEVGRAAAGGRMFGPSANVVDLRALSRNPEGRHKSAADRDRMKRAGPVFFAKRTRARAWRLVNGTTTSPKKVASTFLPRQDVSGRCHATWRRRRGKQRIRREKDSRPRCTCLRTT